MPAIAGRLSIQDMASLTQACQRLRGLVKPLLQPSPTLVSLAEGVEGVSAQARHRVLANVLGLALRQPVHHQLVLLKSIMAKIPALSADLERLKVSVRARAASMRLSAEESVEFIKALAGQLPSMPAHRVSRDELVRHDLFRCSDETLAAIPQAWRFESLTGEIMTLPEILAPYRRQSRRLQSFGSPLTVHGAAQDSLPDQRIAGLGDVIQQIKQLSSQERFEIHRLIAQALQKGPLPTLRLESLRQRLYSGAFGSGF